MGRYRLADERRGHDAEARNHPFPYLGIGEYRRLHPVRLPGIKDTESPGSVLLQSDALDLRNHVCVPVVVIHERYAGRLC